MSAKSSTRESVAASLERAPIVGVVRTHSLEEADWQARTFWAGGVELIEITFTVPGAEDLVRELISGRRDATGPPWFGMGTATTSERAERALEADAEFLVTPNVQPEVARLALAARRFLILGALTPTEIVTARDLGADLVKVYPLPGVGGPEYLKTVRGPLEEIPMLAAGGFGVEEIPAYRSAGARAFGMGTPLLGADEEESRSRIERALALARGEDAG